MASEPRRGHRLRLSQGSARVSGAFREETIHLAGAVGIECTVKTPQWMNENFWPPREDLSEEMRGSGVGLVVVAVLVWAVVQATPRRSDTGPRTATGSAEAILADRFARGEIDDDEYRRRLGALCS